MTGRTFAGWRSLLKKNARPKPPPCKHGLCRCLEPACCRPARCRFGHRHCTLGRFVGEKAYAGGRDIRSRLHSSLPPAPSQQPANACLCNFGGKPGGRP